MKRFLVCLVGVGVASLGHAQSHVQSLFQGAWTGQAAAVRGALESGQVNVNMAMDDGTTALIAATSRGHESVVDVLLEGDADPNLAKDDGETALIIASMYAMNSIAGALIESGADVNAKDTRGRSAWTWAAWGENESLQSLLKKSGADGSGEADPFQGGAVVDTFETRPDWKKGKTPKISEELREAGIAGNVELRVILEQNGKVRSVELLQGLHDELDREVLELVQKWTFSPGELQGKPVPGVMNLEVEFVLAGKRDGYVRTRAHMLP